MAQTLLISGDLKATLRGGAFEADLVVLTQSIQCIAVTGSFSSCTRTAPGGYLNLKEVDSSTTRWSGAHRLMK